MRFFASRPAMSAIWPSVFCIQASNDWLRFSIVRLAWSFELAMSSHPSPAECGRHPCGSRASALAGATSERS
eukprot:5506096-Heterocapsa_arctica.AAC.1